jgi:dihydroorotate dehydrogenase
MQAFISSFTRLVYKHCLKPIFFQFNPEQVHNLMVSNGVFLGKSNLAKQVLSRLWAYRHPNLIKKIDGITFPNPVGLSAGFDYNADLVNTLPAVGFGFHTIGTVTLEPYDGNTPPRLARFPRSKALLVNKGLKNIGAKAIIKKLKNHTMSIPVGISIASTNKVFKNEAAQITDIIECFKLFEGSRLRHSYYELNISCPNTFGGEPFTTPDKLNRLMTHMDKLKLSRPLYIKMPIDQTQAETRALLTTLANHAVQGVIFGNLTKDKNNPDVNLEDKKNWQTRKGNLSGKPTWKRSNACIALVKKEFGSRFTIIGTGGIFSAQDAQEKMRLGADLVQLITGMIFEGPQLIGQINKHLATHNV